MKKFFVAGYTGDIGNAIFQYLQKKGFDAVGISGRWSDDKIKNVILDNINNRYIQYYLINAIGCGVYGNWLDLCENDYLTSFKCNFLVPIKVIKIYLKELISKFPNKNIKKIVFNINSKAALKPFWYGGAYNSVKIALSMNLKILEKEYKNYGVKVKQMYPGVIETKMLKKMPYLPSDKNIQTLNEFIKDFEKEINL